MPSRTVKPNISLNAEQTLSQTDLTSAPIRAKPNEPKVGKSFALAKQPCVFCSKLPMLQQEAESIKDVKVGESFAERK